MLSRKLTNLSVRVVNPGQVARAVTGDQHQLRIGGHSRQNLVELTVQNGRVRGHRQHEGLTNLAVGAHGLNNRQGLGDGACFLRVNSCFGHLVVQLGGYRHHNGVTHNGHLRRVHRTGCSLRRRGACRSLRVLARSARACRCARSLRLLACLQTLSGGTLAVLNGLLGGGHRRSGVYRQTGRSSRHNSGKSHRNRQELGARGLESRHRTVSATAETVAADRGLNPAVRHLRNGEGRHQNTHVHQRGTVRTQQVVHDHGKRPVPQVQAIGTFAHPAQGSEVQQAAQHLGGTSEHIGEHTLNHAQRQQGGAEQTPGNRAGCRLGNQNRVGNQREQGQPANHDAGERDQTEGLGYAVQYGLLQRRVQRPGARERQQGAEEQAVEVRVGAVVDAADGRAGHQKSGSNAQ